jgi:hypothetical protein
LKIGPLEFTRTQRPTPSMIFADTPSGAAENISRSDLSEIGSTAGGQYSSILMRDYNPKMSGKEAIKTFDEMRRSDAQVRGTLRLVKTPIISAQWYVEAASDSEQDLEIAAFVEWNLHHMSRSWSQVLWEALLCMDFGAYYFEKVYELGEWRPATSTRGPRKTVVKWRKLAPRHPSTLDHFNFDENGGISSVFFDRIGGKGGDTVVEIPIEKLLVFTLDEESGNPTGISILRSAYMHWYYKQQLYKIDAIQKERHGIGVPRIALPVGYKAADVTAAKELGRNLRTNESSYIVQPPLWEIDFVEVKGNLVNALESAEHHDLMIARNVLAQFLNLGSTESGSRAVSGDMTTIFMRALRYLGDSIAAVFNQYCIRQLVDYNYTVEEYPRLRVRKIGENADWRAFSVAYRNFVESNAITPTPEDEKWLRDQIDMPAPSPAARGRTVKDRVAEPEASPSSNGSQPGGPSPVPTNGSRSNRVSKPADGG